MQHRLQIEGRAADHLEHVGGGSLLLQGLGEVVRALAQLVEQPGVFDGDDGLGGEVPHQRNLLIGERPDFLSVDDDTADQHIVLKHGHRDERSRAGKFDQPNGTGIALRISRGPR